MNAVDEGVARPQLLLVSKDVRDCVLRRLFRTVEIDNTDHGTEQLRGIISQPANSIVLSTASGYVKRLVLRFSYDHDGRNLHEFFDQDNVIAILTTIQREGHLSGLTFKLVANAEDEEGRPHCWNDLSERFRAVLASLLQLPSLTSISIDGLGDVPQELGPGNNPNMQTSVLPSIVPGSAAKEKVKTDFSAFRFTTFDALEEIWSDIEKVGSTIKKLKLTEKYEDYASATVGEPHLLRSCGTLINPHVRQ